MKKRILKRIFTGAAAAVTLFMCGCVSPISQSRLSPGGIDRLYTAVCDITVDSGDETSEPLSYSGNMCRLGGGFWEMSLTSPETVAGLKISLGPEGIGASLGDLNFNLETDKIPSRAAFLKIFSALDNAASSINDLKQTENEANLCYSGTCGGEKYTVLCDKAQNMPCGLIMGKITVVFSSFTVTGNAPETTAAPSESAPSVTTVTVEETTAGTTAESSSMPSVTLVSSETVTSASETEVTSAQTSEAVTMTSPFFTTAEENASSSVTN